MAKMLGRVTGNDAVRHADGGKRCALQRQSIAILQIFAVKIQVGKSGGQKLHRLEALVEMAGRSQLVHQCGRHGLAGLIMAGEAGQHLRLLQPVLEQLRGQLHEIARHIGAGEARVTDLGQQTMQGMAEFVKHGAGIVEGQERRIALDEIAIVGADAKTLLSSVMQLYIPNKVVQASEKEDELYPLLNGKIQKENETKIYLCRNYSCKQPVNDANSLIKLLQ